MYAILKFYLANELYDNQNIFLEFKMERHLYLGRKEAILFCQYSSNTNFFLILFNHQQKNS